MNVSKLSPPVSRIEFEDGSRTTIVEFDNRQTYVSRRKWHIELESFTRLPHQLSTTMSSARINCPSGRLCLAGRPLLRLLPLITLLVAMTASARDLERLEKPELATVLALQQELARTPPRSTQPYFVRVFSVPAGVYECGGSVESCPDVRLYVTVSFGDLGETPALFEMPARKGWEFVGWVTPSDSGQGRMASFRLRTILPEANIDPEARRAWRAEEFLVLVSPGSASYIPQ